MSGSPLEEVLRDAALVLARERVPDALIGGVGAIFYGSTRATRDVDLSIDSSPGTLSALCRSLEAAGFSSSELRGAVVQARHPNGYRLDLLAAQSSFKREVIAGASVQEQFPKYLAPIAGTNRQRAATSSAAAAATRASPHRHSVSEVPGTNCRPLCSPPER